MGFFDTGAEQDRSKEIGKEFRPTTLENMEGRRRKVCISNFSSELFQCTVPVVTETFV